MQTLDSLLENMNQELGGAPGMAAFNMTNLDDIFIIIASRGITDVIVTHKQMQTILGFFLATIKDNTDLFYNLIREGKIDKFWGVNLHLEK